MEIFLVHWITLRKWLYPSSMMAAAAPAEISEGKGTYQRSYRITGVSDLALFIFHSILQAKTHLCYEANKVNFLRVFWL